MWQASRDLASPTPCRESGWASPLGPGSELYYVVADERDVIRVRTNYRGEDVYLYRLGPEVARALLLDYVSTLNALAARPRADDAGLDFSRRIRAPSNPAAGATAQ